MRTDRHDEANSRFSDFANAPQKKGHHYFICRVHSYKEKATVLQLVKKFPASYEPRKFTTLLTRASVKSAHYVAETTSTNLLL
jgi:hypothetical protein